MLGLASARWGQSTKPGQFTAGCNSNDLTMAGTAGAGGATRAMAHYYPVVVQPGAGQTSHWSLSSLELATSVGTGVLSTRCLHSRARH